MLSALTLHRVMDDDTLRADLFEMPVEIIKIERRKQNATGDDVVVDYLVQIEYDLGLGKVQTINMYMDEVPPGLVVGSGFFMCLEARS